MINFNIQNATQETATIDILGDIGEGWFEEGITMDSINNQLNSITAKNITVNISSLGGDLNTALAVYDLLRMKNANITVKIIGATASSGTVISMAGNKIEMSDNALFLVHNASTGAWGNAEEMREQANQLDVWDSRIINIYKKRTGKRKSQISSLMEEDKWITATEAKEWGFIDNIFNSEKVLNKATIDKINNSNLPKIKTNKMEKFKNIMALLGVDKIEGSLNEEQLAIVNDKLVVNEAHITAELTTKHEEEVKKINAEHKVVVDNHSGTVADIDAKHKTEIEAKDKELVDAKKEKEDLQEVYNTYVKDNPPKSGKEDGEGADPSIGGDKTPKVKDSLGSISNIDSKLNKWRAKEKNIEASKENK